jgi:hypothetical protein
LKTEIRKSIPKSKKGIEKVSTPQVPFSKGDVTVDLISKKS